MKTKQVFALYGTASVGKSSTIKRVFALLTETYPKTPIETINPLGIDITVIIEIAGVLVGIESQGDPNSRLVASIALFRKKNCGIIVCASRTRGGTVAAIEDLQPEYSIVWHHKTSEPDLTLRERSDETMAQTIFKQIKDAITA